MVRNIYTINYIRAVSLIFGLNLSLVGPVVSAAKRCTPLIPSMGRIAIEMTTIPNPPSQWVIARQKRMPWDNSSILSRIDAPVVVKPDMVSKKALV